LIRSSSHRWPNDQIQNATLLKVKKEIMQTKIIVMNSLHMLGLAMLAALLLPAAAAAQSAPPAWESGKWEYAATIYGWVPTIDGKLNYAGDSRTSDIHVNEGNVLSHLKMAFQGALDVHNGRWGIFNDLVYVDLGGSKSRSREFSVEGIPIPGTANADLNLDFKGLVWTVAGEYRVVSDPAWTVDLLAGARMLQVKPTLNYSITGDLGPVVLPGRNGSKQVNETAWDGIVGVKGRYAFADDHKWFVPFYLDVGTGQTQLTWEGATGVGYAFSWGEVSAMYRYMDWNAQSGKPLENLNMGGAQVAVTFRW